MRKHPSFLLPSLQFLSCLLAFCHFLNQVVLAGLSNDEVEHAHAGWLVSRGSIPFQDFFEHHSPAYLYLVGWFAQIWPDARFLFPLRLAQLGCAVISIGCLCVCLLRSNGESKRGRWLGSLFGANVFLLLTPFTAAFAIRSEPFAIMFVLGSFALAFAAPKRPTLPLLLAAAAILFSPRALLPVIPISMRLLADNFRLAEGRKLLLKAALATSCLLWIGLSLPPGFQSYFKFVILGTRSLEPRWPLSSTFSQFRSLTTYLIVVAVVAFARIATHFLPPSQSTKKPSAPELRIFAAWTLLAAWVGPLIEKRAYYTSLSLVAVFSAVYLAAEVQVRLRRPLKWPEGAFIPLHALLVSLILLPPLPTWLPLFEYRLASLARLGLEVVPIREASEIGDPLDFQSSNASVVDAQNARNRVCAHLRGARVVVSTWYHPICLPDSTYWWYGVFFSTAGSFKGTPLDTAIPPASRMLSEILASPPEMISSDWEILPHLKSVARSVGQEKQLEEFLRFRYEPRSFYFKLRP